jgi:hypothetical protein
MHDPQPVPPTLEQLRRASCWWWVHCQDQGCLHTAPLALTPLIIRWGPATSSDKLRACARCSRCGHKGATLQHPSWEGREIGWLPFPAEFDGG